MSRLIFDAMGADRGPRAAIEGLALALSELDPCEVILLGDETEIRAVLAKRAYSELRAALEGSHPKVRVQIQHCSEVIEMTDSIKAIRSKPGASINVGCQMAAQDWKKFQKGEIASPSAFISAGHSGAMMAAALLNMGRIKGVERPAIAVIFPSMNPEGCVMLDVGANVDCKPEHLRDFAVMGSLFSQARRSRPGIPKVAILSNGEERSKGNTQTSAAYELVEKLDCFKPGPGQIAEFVGYAEGKEIFQGKVDVVVTDGFVGNVVLKSLESLGSTIVSLIKQEAKSNPFNTLGFLIANQALRSLRKKMDYAEVGAAPLLGVAGYAWIAHGRSNAKAFKNALVKTQWTVKNRFLERFETAMSDVHS